MNLLLDTHALLWALAEPQRLPTRIADAIRSPRNKVYVSAVSIWELAIKAGLGRIDLPFPDLEAAIAGADFSELPVTIPQTLRLRDLPRHHRDPFDRLLVAQALEEGMSLVSADRALRAYPVKVLWT